MITVKGKTFDSKMPPIGAGFSAEEIAAITTYERNSWGNSYGPVTKEEVEKIMSEGPAPAQ